MSRRAASLVLIAGVGLLLAGALKFAQTAFLPAMRDLAGGDFMLTFPATFFTHWRRDFHPADTLNGWQYGPMFHFATAPLLLVSRFSMVSPVWTVCNLVFLLVSFVLVLRLSERAGQLPAGMIAAMAGLWLSFLPLRNCFAQGNIELLEMMVVLASVAALRKERDERAGVLMGIASMIKFLPAGFVVWFAMRGRWRAVRLAALTIVLIALVTSVTLRWSDNILFRMNQIQVLKGVPYGDPETLSVTSLFLHLAGRLDGHALQVRWFPLERAQAAARIGQLVSVAIAAVYAWLLWRRRRAPFAAAEISLLFVAMFTLVPWNHEYYYALALVPWSLLFVAAVMTRRWGLLVLTLLAYVLMSPPIPLSWIDRLHWFNAPAAYLFNYANLPLVGALLLWIAATYELLSLDRSAPGRLIRALAAAAPTVVPIAAGALAFFVTTARLEERGVFVEIIRRGGTGSFLYRLPEASATPGASLSGPATAALSELHARVNSIFVVADPGSDLARAASTPRLSSFVIDEADPAMRLWFMPLPASVRQVHPLVYHITSDDLEWVPGKLALNQYVTVEHNRPASIHTIRSMVRLELGARRFDVKLGPVR